MDTGCSRIMVQSHFVCKEELLKESTIVHCTHGDFKEYPMAKVCIEVNGQKFTTVSSNLPVDVLLGTDMPTLGTLIQGGAMAVTTRSRAKREALTEADYQKLLKWNKRGIAVSTVFAPIKEPLIFSARISQIF